MPASDPRASTPQNSGAGRALWPQILVLLVAAAACYANSLHGPWLLDDPRPGTRLDYGRRPLVWASFDLNRALSGEETWSFHVFNVLVHALCGLLLLGVLRRTLAHATPSLRARTRGDLAFVTALLWLCHPLQTGSVSYLSQRAESMAALAYLAVLYAFLRAASAARPLGWQALALLALAAGFATKETIGTAPLVLLLLDALFLGPDPMPALRRRWKFHSCMALVALALAVAYVAPTLFSGANAMGLKLRAFGPLDYARTQPGVILHYLRLVFWPHPLCFDPGWPIARAPHEWLPQSAAIVGLLAATVALCVRRSWVGFALAFFFLVLAPTSSFVPIQDPAFEHRMYLPLAAVLALVVVGAWRLMQSPSARRWLPILAGATTLALAALTIRRNQDYRSAVRLMQLTVACAPQHARAHLNLAVALHDAGRTEEAVPVLTEALRLDPRDGYSYMNLGIAFVALGQVERAIPLLERAVEFVEDPRFLEALGQARFLLGDHAGSAPPLERALALDPSNAFLHCRFAYALAKTARPEQALEHFREALRLDPELQEAHLQLAALLLELGQPEEALQHALRALEFAPNTTDELLALGRTFRACGRLVDAARAFQEAVRLDPTQPEPYAGFADAVSARPEASTEERREALRMALAANEMTGSTRADFLEICARARAALGEFGEAARLLEHALALPGPAGDAALAGRLRTLCADYAERAGR